MVVSVEVERAGRRLLLPHWSQINLLTRYVAVAIDRLLEQVSAAGAAGMTMVTRCCDKGLVFR